MRILISGLGGFMGREVAKLALEGYRGAELTAGVDLMGAPDAPVPCAKSFAEARTDVDVVVDGTDNLEIRYLLNEACNKHGIRWVYGGVVGSGGMVMNILPGEGPCLQCLLGELPEEGTYDHRGRPPSFHDQKCRRDPGRLQWPDHREGHA